MAAHKKIILVGPAGAGKDFIKSKFHEKGFICDVSYTTRKPREGEKYGEDYNFISRSEFTLRISQGAFYEHIKHGEYFYGTGLYEWNNSDVFIMETDGIAHIKAEDRPNCLVIFINTPLEIRRKRLEERGWNEIKIMNRINIDQQKFNVIAFMDFDFQISSVSYSQGLPNFNKM